MYLYPLLYSSSVLDILSFEFGIRKYCGMIDTQILFTLKDSASAFEISIGK